MKIDILQIAERPHQTVGVYTPLVDDASHEYGTAVKYDLWAICKAWYTDTNAMYYAQDAGFGATKSTTIYIAAKGRDAAYMDEKPLPSRVGIQIGEDPEVIRPARTVDNYYDFDGSYAYSVVVVDGG